MKHVKLFEEFNEEGNLSQGGPKTYIYHITNSSDKNFSADVRDSDGKVIFELKPTDISNDGLMKNKDDINGLYQMLLNKNKIKKGETIVPANAVDKSVGGAASDFVPELNTNMNQNIFNIKTTEQ